MMVEKQMERSLESKKSYDTMRVFGVLVKGKEQAGLKPKAQIKRIPTFRPLFKLFL